MLPAVALLLLGATPKPQPDVPLSYRKDEYPGGA